MRDIVTKLQSIFENLHDVSLNHIMLLAGSGGVPISISYQNEL